MSSQAQPISDNTDCTGTGNIDAKEGSTSDTETSLPQRPKGALQMMKGSSQMVPPEIARPLLLPPYTSASKSSRGGEESRPPNAANTSLAAAETLAHGSLKLPKAVRKQQQQQPGEPEKTNLLSVPTKESVMDEAFSMPSREVVHFSSQDDLFCQDIPEEGQGFQMDQVFDTTAITTVTSPLIPPRRCPSIASFHSQDEEGQQVVGQQQWEDSLDTSRGSHHRRHHLRRDMPRRGSMESETTLSTGGFGGGSINFSAADDYASDEDDTLSDVFSVQDDTKGPVAAASRPGLEDLGDFRLHAMMEGIHIGSAIESFQTDDDEPKKPAPKK